MNEKGCVKCGTRDAATKEMEASGSSIVQTLDIPQNSFIVISCRNCGYSEFYNKESADASKVEAYFFNDGQ